jgi:hypothetical protein
MIPSCEFWFPVKIYVILAEDYSLEGCFIQQRNKADIMSLHRHAPLRLPLGCAALGQAS